MTELHTFLVLTDLRTALPLGPVSLALLLLRQGSVLLGWGAHGVPRGAGLFSASFLWEATLLFSLKLSAFLSRSSAELKSTCCPFLIRSRYSFRADWVPGLLSQLRNSSSTFFFSTGWRTCAEGIALFHFFGT